MFKEYNQHQILLLPPDISQMVPQDHLARVINDVVDRLEINALTRQYNEAGQHSFHPRMLLKVLFYGYATEVRSSRKIAKKLEEDVIYMWLAGMQKPDFRTIALFRQKRLKQIKAIFVEIASICLEIGITKIGRVYIDGTKIEANASGHKMIYAKALEKRQNQIEYKIQEMLDEAKKNDEIEDSKYQGKKGETIPRELRKKVNRLKKLEEAAKRVKEQKDLLNQRSNYSKTDKEANLMKMKRDYIYPGYNMQLTTSNQVILDYQASNRCNDMDLLKPQVEQIKRNYKEKPKQVIADSGYGTESNHLYLNKEDIQAIIPYQSLEKERSKAYRENKYRRENFHYDKKRNIMICPEGNLMQLVYKGKNNRGQYIKKFQTVTCPQCPGRESCTPSEYRSYEYRPRWERIRQKIRKKMSQPKFKKIYKTRKMDVEAVIGNIKHNLGFKKYLLRGLEKVNIETGLVAIAHNLVKIVRFRQDLLYNGP